jgi:hypothetical protein
MVIPLSLGAASLCLLILIPVLGAAPSPNLRAGCVEPPNKCAFSAAYCCSYRVHDIFDATFSNDPLCRRRARQPLQCLLHDLPSGSEYCEAHTHTHTHTHTPHSHSYSLILTHERKYVCRLCTPLLTHLCGHPKLNAYAKMDKALLFSAPSRQTGTLCCTATIKTLPCGPQALREIATQNSSLRTAARFKYCLLPTKSCGVLLVLPLPRPRHQPVSCLFSILWRISQPCFLRFSGDRLLLTHLGGTNHPSSWR